MLLSKTYLCHVPWDHHHDLPAPCLVHTEAPRCSFGHQAIRLASHVLSLKLAQCAARAQVLLHSLRAWQFVSLPYVLAAQLQQGVMSDKK